MEILLAAGDTAAVADAVLVGDPCVDASDGDPVTVADDADFEEVPPEAPGVSVRRRTGTTPAQSERQDDADRRGSER
jgi:hypothetical protein